MSSPLRLATALSALAATALLVAGCTSSPGSTAPVSSDSPGASSAPTDHDDMDDIEGAWLDAGRMFAVVTMGSSTCAPLVDTVTAKGQEVAVTLVDLEGDNPCTADMAPRASVGELPEGVDPTKDVKLTVTYGDLVDDVDLDGNAAHVGVPGTSTDFTPSAGWFGDGSLVLLTWGSSTCLPIVESLEGSGNAGTVTFGKNDGVCTRDMAPRATVLSFGDDAVEEDAFTLTLVGGDLDGTVKVLGD